MINKYLHATLNFANNTSGFMEIKYQRKFKYQVVHKFPSKYNEYISINNVFVPSCTWNNNHTSNL